MNTLHSEKPIRTVYLLRHGAVQFYGEEKRYLGHTDLPLTREGVHQALRLKEYFRTRPVEAVISSPLRRCADTAALAFPGHSARIRDGLIEQNCGEWENRTFSEIRKKDPLWYEKRGEDLAGFPPRGGETLYSCLARMKMAMGRILAETSGDVAVVAHATVNRVFLAEAIGVRLHEIREISQPASCINTLAYNGSFWPISIGEIPHKVPIEEEIHAIYAKYGISPQVQKHSRTVADLAIAMAKAVSHEESLDLQLLSAAAKLHDIARNAQNHAETARLRLERKGYPLIGEIIAFHHDLPENLGEGLSAAFILNLADKYCMEDRIVTLQERFSASVDKCKSDEALKIHQNRYEKALRMERIYRKVADKGLKKENV